MCNDDRIDKLEKEIDELRKTIKSKGILDERNSIDNRTLLIVNATVIAGLFILTSITAQYQNLDNSILFIIITIVSAGIFFLGLSSILILSSRNLEFARFLTATGMFVFIPFFWLLGLLTNIAELISIVIVTLIGCGVFTGIIYCIKYRH